MSVLITPKIFSDDLVKQFAQKMITSPSDQYANAMLLVDNSVAYRFINYCLSDKIYLQETERLKSEGNSSKILSKEAICEKILNLAESALVDSKDRIGAYKLYADMNGMIEKPQMNMQINTHVNNKVMVLPAELSPEDFQKRALIQQRELKELARATITN